MADASLADLHAVDRDVARGVTELARWRRSLAIDVEAAAEVSPLEPVRRVAGKATYDGLGELAPVALDVPWRDGLRAWVAALVLARVQQDDDVAWARAASDEAAHYGGEPPGQVSWRQAWRSVPGARSAGEVHLWLDAAADVAPRLADATRERAGRRLEAARRLGLEHPWQTAVAADRAALRAGAERLLRATDDLAVAMNRPILRDGGGVAAALHVAVGRDASEGWPARLTARWLEEMFERHVGGLRLVLPAMPAAAGASSFARALASFGAALRHAAVGKSTPFALGHEPGDRDAHRLAYVFGALAGDVTWQTRALGLVQRAAAAQARVLGQTMLLHARLSAMRLLLGDDADPAPRDVFAELGARVFGAPLDERLRGAWPVARDDEAARLVALLEALPFAEGLRERFDLDWFLNPRAWTHLRAVSALPTREPVTKDGLEAGADRLARAFEAALG